MDQETLLFLIDLRILRNFPVPTYGVYQSLIYLHFLLYILWILNFLPYSNTSLFNMLKMLRKSSYTYTLSDFLSKSSQSGRDKKFLLVLSK